MDNFIYYVQVGNDQKGPLTVEELKQIRVTPDTLVWRNDSPKWLSAKYFAEIRDSLVELPPLYHRKLKKLKKSKNLNY